MRLLSDRPINRGQKYETFFSERFQTPHPRINDEAKLHRGSILTFYSRENRRVVDCCRLLLTVRSMDRQEVVS